MSMLLVDGYNIINALSHYQDIAKESLEEARIRLVEDLIFLQTVGERKIIVVFDAAKTEALVPVTQNIEGVEVVFTSHGNTADAYVEKRALSEVENNRVFVATADYYQQMMVFGKGVFRMTPEELGKEIMQAKERTYGALPERSPMIFEERIERKVRKTLKELFLKIDTPSTD